MIIVTGGAGFIGSNIVKSLNDDGRQDILVVDNLTNAEKCWNLSGLQIYDFLDKNKFLECLKQGLFDNEKIDVIFHQGACSDTMEYNGKYMMENNYEYSKETLQYCLQKKISFIYASSASTYGDGKNGFTEKSVCEEALNVYAYSKLLFDRYVNRLLPRASSQIVGLRYFNVFGPQEKHKGKMASMVYQMYNKVKAGESITLFEGVDANSNGEQKRDFIYIKDVVKINKFFWQNPQISGVFNCGTGKANTFNALAKSVIDYFGKGQIEYITFPSILKGKYQDYTQADTTKLLSVGYKAGFMELDKAVRDYCAFLDNTKGYF